MTDKPTEYVVSVPNSVYAPGIDEIVIKYPESVKDTSLMVMADLAFDKMLVEPKDVGRDCHSTFYAFIVACATNLIDECSTAAQDQWEERKFEDDGSLKFSYDGYDLNFIYPTAAKIKELIAAARGKDEFRRSKSMINATITQPPANIFTTNVKIYEFCLSIAQKIITDGAQQAGEAWAAKRTR